MPEAFVRETPRTARTKASPRGGFAALCLRFRRDLDAGPERMNPNGGTIAMGHAAGLGVAVLVERVAT